MMLTTGDVTEAMYGSLMRIQRGWSYRYQYRVIVGVEVDYLVNEFGNHIIAINLIAFRCCLKNADKISIV